MHELFKPLNNTNAYAVVISRGRRATCLNHMKIIAAGVIFIWTACQALQRMPR
uniref:Uncharacterized protein n=1 Tax=Arundo donax TaxID=35708 RepID=A0A0A9TK85_ARUDO